MTSRLTCAVPVLPDGERDDRQAAVPDRPNPGSPDSPLADIANAVREKAPYTCGHPGLIRLLLVSRPATAGHDHWL